MMKKETLSYIAVGVCAVGADYISYLLLVGVVSITAAKVISYIVGMTVAFICQRKWTFQSNNAVHKDMMKFIVIYVTSLLSNVYLNQAMLFFFPSLLTFCFAVATALSIMINYLGQKFWVFRKA